MTYTLYWEDEKLGVIEVGGPLCPQVRQACGDPDMVRALLGVVGYKQDGLKAALETLEDWERMGVVAQ